MNLLIWICHLLVYFGLVTLEGHGEKLSDLQILDDLLRNYDRRANPSEITGNATEVSIEIYLRSFGSISPATMVRSVANPRAPYSSCTQQSTLVFICTGKDGARTLDWQDYEADLYLYQRWTDERLTHQNISHTLEFSDPRIVQTIWKPEVFFPNAKDANFQYVTVPNVVVRIHPGGEILYMLRLRLTFSCMMDLTKFPLDRQVCSIELASFAKTTSDLLLSWDSKFPVKVYEGLKLPQFTIENIVTAHCVETFHIGEKSCLRADISLKRSLGYHLVQSYLPTTIIVVVSWVSFWLEVDAIPARVTLGVTTLLTISSESTGTRPNLPPVSYIKALDVWMGACTTFIFVALLEFTCVNYLSRHTKRRRGPKHQKKQQSQKVLHAGIPCCVKPGEVKSCTVVPLPNNNNSSINHKALAKKIDRLSRVIFPVMYLIFNIIYWLYYTL